jgi:hypothetical protein
MLKMSRVTGAGCLAATALALTACGSASNPVNETNTSPAPVQPSDTTSPQPSGTFVPAGPTDGSTGEGLATDCIRPLVEGPDASGNTVISAELDGAWPEDAEIHTSVTFGGSTALEEFSNAGHSVTVSDQNGDPVTTVKVWVTGANGFGARCNTWALQP